MDSSETSPPPADNRFELLVRNVTDYAIYMIDPTGIVTSWNAGAERIKGYGEEEIVGQHFSRFFTQEDRDAGLPARALATAEREGRFEMEGWRVRKDGSRFWASAVLDAVRDPAGRLIGFAKITRDLTERREAQFALERAQDAIFQAQKMDAIGKLTGGVAHDFNNLLAVVIGSLDLAQRRLAGGGGDISRFIGNAMQAAERGATLTQRMLAFARRQDLKLDIVDLAELVRGMAELLQRTLGTDVAIETRFPLMLRPVHADPGQLELALLNLAVNARDAMPRGGTIIISAREEMAPGWTPPGLPAGDYACLSVQDDGEGMDEPTLARAMEPFFTTKGIGKGTGLGLSMVHGLTEQCGGRFVLNSRPGEGTIAELWLPISSAVIERPAKTQAEPPAEPVRSLTILAVDDDTLVLANTAAMLEDLGHQVLQATSGREALEILATQGVDLVLTDYAMPEMTGAELAEAIRAARPTLPILMVAGYAELPSGTATALPKLAKPFREDQLARTIHNVVSAAPPAGRVLKFRSR